MARDKFETGRKPNWERRKEFRAFYWRKQVKRMIILNTICIVFGVVGLLFLVPAVFKDNLMGGYISMLPMPICSFIFETCEIILICGKSHNDRRALLADILAFISSLIFLLMGVNTMYLSTKGGGSPEVIVWLMSLAVSTAFFYYPAHSFLLMVFISAISVAILGIRYGISIEPASLTCCITFAIILVVMGISRYHAAMASFEATRKNEELINQLEDSNEELKRINATQRDFSASLNHELRAPLNGIVGTVQVLLLDEKITGEQRDNLEICMKSSKSLIGIVNDLLDFSKLEAGSFDIIPARFDLHNLVNNTMVMFGNVAESKGLKLNLEISPNTVCGLIGDDLRIQQVVTNIISNAIKYTSSGYVTFHVSVADGKLNMRISDTGQGISEESMKNLFVPFKRLNEENNKKIEGTGLGLTIVHKLVEQMKGTIEVESKRGEGTTFVVSIPVEIYDEENKWKGVPKAEEKPVATDTVDLSGIKILYVDDTEANLKIVPRLIKDTNVEFETTNNPFTGLNLVSTKKYDLIFLDHQMPGLDGLEIFEQLKEEKGINENTPCIIFTGNAMVGAKERYEAMGFAGYLGKPVMRPDLISGIVNALEKAKKSDN